MWNIDFESWPVGTSGAGWSGVSSAASPYPVFSALITDVGGSQGHVLTLSADSSACTGPWSGDWTVPLQIQSIRRSNALTGYVPERTYLSFDAWVSKLIPFRVRLEYTDSAPSVRDLETYVYPSVVGSFERFVVPLSSLSQTFFLGNPPDNPTSFVVYMDGYPSATNAMWGYSSGNVLSIDNVSYYVLPPPLDLKADGAGNLLISWPTNVTGYVLQESPSFRATNWSDVVTVPIPTNERNQIILSPTGEFRFYRLRGP
jgi:hypothetical protein